ncbi:MAG: hypothetical protein NVS1B2_26840 [Vulcanimicrobiaceae bacterium]
MKSSSRDGGHAGVGAFERTARVRLADTDASGTLSLGGYARFCDIAETEFFRSLGFSPATFAQRNALLTRVHVEFDFFRSARPDDVLTIRISVAGVGVHSVRSNVELLRDDVLLAEAVIVNAFLDGARKSIAIPDDLATALRACVLVDR